MVDLKLALRTLTRSKIVTGVAVLSLALGIGANTAIFSLYDQLLLRPLAVREPEQLVNLAAPGPNDGSQSCGNAGTCEEIFSYPMFRDLEREQRVFTGLAAHMQFGANIGVAGQTPINRSGLYVSGSYFPVLGLRPALGRLFTPQDDQTAGAHSLAVLSYDYWRNSLGADPSVLNQTIVVNGQPMTVIGVAPRGFRSTTIGTFPAVFVPLTMRGVLSHDDGAFTDRRAYWAYLFARRRPGVTIEQARQALAVIYRPILSDIEAPLQKGMSDRRLAEFKRKVITLEDGRRGQSQAHREARTPLLLLFAVTGIVLFIACANIANLLLSRAASRSMEMAVRLALGASRQQLVRQLLVESCLLALLGGLLSVLIARWTLAIVVASAPPEAASFMSGLLNTKVLFFAMLLSVTTGLVFGLFPALHSTRPDLITIIRANSGQPSGARAASRFRSSLVTAQIALSTALLISAGLFVKSLINVSRVELGLATDHVVTFALSPGLNGYRGERTQALIDRVQGELAATPGVSDVTASLVPVLSGSSWGTSVLVQGYTKTADGSDESRLNEVSAGYFRALGIPLLAGREFERSDGTGSPKVAIINEAFARKFNLGTGANAIGKFMAESRGDSTRLDMQIVGVVRNAKYNSVRDEIPPLFFKPISQDSTIGMITFYARTVGDATPLLRAVPGMVARLEPTVPVENLKTLPQQVKDNIRPDQMIGLFSSAFASLATLLAAIGLYGVLAFSVAQRTREIGVRMALGANRGQVRAMVLRQVARMTVIGGVIGVAGALAFGREARSLLYGLEGSDPTVIVLSVLLLSLVALSAGFVPAWRASRVHPMQALRYE